MSLWFGRVTHESVFTHPQITVLVAVRHHADKSVKRTHIHYVVRSELCEREFKKAVRTATGLEGRMDIAFKLFDTSRSFASYFVDHSEALVLVSEAPFKSEIDEALADLAAKKAEREKIHSDQEAKWAADRAKREDEFQKQWDASPDLIPPFEPVYKRVQDRLDYVSGCWSLKHPEWDWVDYTTQLLKFLTNNPDYKAIYSTYRLKGDAQLMYAKYWPEQGFDNSRHRIFGH